MSLPCTMSAKILKCGHLRFVSVCAADLVAASLSLLSAGEIDWTVPDCLSWFLYSLANAAIISVPKTSAESSRLGLRINTLSEPIYEKVVFCCIEKFRDAGISRDFAEVVWASYKLDGTD